MNNELRTTYDWYTHLPIIQYFIDNFDIEYAVEHGSGTFSTPILMKAKHYQGFEEDEQFRQSMINEGIYTSENVSQIDIPDGVDIATTFMALSASQTGDLAQIYYNLYFGIKNELEGLNGLKMLFVDGFTCSRFTAINQLYDLFDIIVYHDCEPNSFEHYGYQHILPIISKYFNGYKLATPSSYTGFFVRKGVNVDMNLLREYIDLFCEKEEFDYNDMYLLIDG